MFERLDVERWGYPHPGWFLAKSAELSETKGVAFCGDAKKRKRVRKNMKGKGIARNVWKSRPCPYAFVTI
jgi:hypothetical protein